MNAQNRVQKLAIVSHGSTMQASQPGRVDVSPPGTSGSEVLTSDSVDNSFLGVRLSELAEFIVPSGSLIFISCCSGGGASGVELLKAVSRRIPGRDVKAYISWISLSAARRAGEATDTLLASLSVNPNLPGRYPRIREGCSSERVARDSAIIRHPDIAQMWDQLQEADPDRAARITEEWLRSSETLNLHPRPAPIAMDWTRNQEHWPWVVGYRHVEQIEGRRRVFRRTMVTRETISARLISNRSVLRHYAVEHLHE